MSFSRTMACSKNQFETPIINSEPPVAFHRILQIPFAYEVHNFIKSYVPRKAARFIATVWFVGTLVFCCSLSSVLSFFFALIWKLSYYFLSKPVYYHQLELWVGLIFGFCSSLFLFLNCITWPIFECRLSSPSSESSSLPSSLSSSTLSSTAELSLCHRNKKGGRWVGETPLATLKSSEFKKNDCCIQSISTSSSSEFAVLSDDNSDKDNDVDEISVGKDVFGKSNIPAAAKCVTGHYKPKKTIVMVNHLSNADGKSRLMLNRVLNLLC